MSRTIQLLVIDPQNDFCDLPATYLAPDSTPSLPVRGAHADLQRVASFVTAVGSALDAITITLDSHHRLDIAHPGFWQRQDGGAVAPFTQITAAALRAGQFRPRTETDLTPALLYLDRLEARGRYTLMVWPVHCEIGSWGQAVHADVRAAYNRWEEQTLRSVAKIAKGQNRYTEHYSAVLAEVPDPTDPRTLRNDALLAALDSADLLLVAGEASSHCVKATVEDLIEHLPSARPERIVLLTDCMSPVAGFESAHAAFLQHAAGRGVRLATHVEMLAELGKNA